MDACIAGYSCKRFAHWVSRAPWIDATADRVVAVFKVDHTTSIYLGIIRLLDLALSGEPRATNALTSWLPTSESHEVRAQLMRPAFARATDLNVHFLPYGELARPWPASARASRRQRPCRGY